MDVAAAVVAVVERDAANVTMPLMLMNDFVVAAAAAGDERRGVFFASEIHNMQNPK